MSRPGYLIELDLRGRLAVVVGLGPVGRRKAASLRDAGAVVRGVDPAADPADPQLAGLEVVTDPYESRHLEGARLVSAAATAEVNRRVVADAEIRGIWANSATDPDQGSYTVPAVWRDGLVALAVTTGGASPALSQRLRDRAAAAVGPSAAGLAGYLAGLRARVRGELADPSARRRVFAAWSDPRWLELWEAGEAEAVRRALERALEVEVESEAGSAGPEADPA